MASKQIQKQRERCCWKSNNQVLPLRASGVAASEFISNVTAQTVTLVRFWERVQSLLMTGRIYLVCLQQTFLGETEGNLDYGERIHPCRLTVYDIFPKFSLVWVLFGTLES